MQVIHLWSFSPLTHLFSHVTSPWTFIRFIYFHLQIFTWSPTIQMSSHAISGHNITEMHLHVHIDHTAHIYNPVWKRCNNSDLVTVEELYLQKALCAVSIRFSLTKHQTWKRVTIPLTGFYKHCVNRLPIVQFHTSHETLVKFEIRIVLSLLALLKKKEGNKRRWKHAASKERKWWAFSLASFACKSYLNFSLA